MNEVPVLTKTIARKPKITIGISSSLKFKISSKMIVGNETIEALLL